MTPSNVDCVNTPTFIGAAGIGSHPPAQPTSRALNWWQAHYSGNETLRIAAPCLKPRNRAASIGCDRPIVSAHEEGARRNVLKRVSIVSAELQHAAIEAEVWVGVGGFKIEVLPKGQTWGAPLEKIEFERVEPLVAYNGRIINGCSIGRGIRRRHWHSRI